MRDIIFKIYFIVTIIVMILVFLITLINISISVLKTTPTFTIYKEECHNIIVDKYNVRCNEIELEPCNNGTIIKDCELIGVNKIDGQTIFCLDPPDKSMNFGWCLSEMGNNDFYEIKKEDLTLEFLEENCKLQGYSSEDIYYKCGYYIVGVQE